MAESPPPLPPRNANAKDTPALGSPAYSPAGLSELIQHTCIDEKWHPHLLLTCQAPQPTQSVQDDKENVAPEGEPDVSLICQTCHCSVKIHMNLAESRCPIAENLTHHYHHVTEHCFQCCVCATFVKISIVPPILKMDLIQSLSITRPLVQTYADIGQNAQQQPTVASTLLVLLTYVQGLLNGVRRSINTHNQNFQARMGLDESSKRIMEAIGFELKDDHFVAPEPDSPLTDQKRLETIYTELLTTAYDVRQKSGANPALTEAASRVRPGLSSLRSVLEVNEKEEPSTHATKKENAYEELLGVGTGASDQLLTWIYHKLQEENPDKTSNYLDALVEIANDRNSDMLVTEVAMERSKGLVGAKEIKDAYLHFGVTDVDHADDHLLIGLYEVKMSDDPAEKDTHISKLRMIAESRHSQGLIHFLQTGEKPLVSITPGTSALIQGHPVGLNNIGNTCYLNSLLQYYFTLLPFRETILYMDEHVEQEDSPGWSPKKIGGITVDHAEVQRAKKFVSLLRDLFNNLANSSLRAISPEYELAYMALLNEKEEDSQANETKQEPEKASEHQDPENSSMVIDTEKSSVPSPSITSQTADENTAPEPSDGTNSAEAQALDERITISDENTVPTDEPPAYEDIVKDIPIIDEKKPLPPVPQKPAPKAKPNTANMMFGKQQDVTECMGNVMYLVEAALKPMEVKDGEQTRDMVRDLFYGKARQILTYEDTQTLQRVSKVQEEDFSYVIIDASKDKGLYDGLDEYFFAGQVENFHGGRKATREVSVKRFPPVLQIQVQRVQFDRATANVYKSNAYIPFEKVIYLDRYCDENFDMLASRRAQVAGWRKETEENDRFIEELTRNKAYPMPVPEMLKAAAEILAQHQHGEHGQDPQVYEQVLKILNQESELAKEAIAAKTQRNKELKDKIRKQYDDLQEYAYRLHAVFIHQGQANYGHYWIYIYDSTEDQWWKYNDSRVSKVNESEIFQDTTGSTANPYFLVYVKADDADSLVETVVRPAVNPAA